MRQLLAVVAGAAVGAFGALLLGEYDLVGVTALAAGALLGAAVAEVAGVVARRSFAMWFVAVIGLVGAASMTWAVWISTNRFRNPVVATAIAGIVTAGAAAVAWLSTGGRRGASSPPVA